MRICTWKSEEAPITHRWIAKFCVPVRESKKQSKDEGREGPHAVDKQDEKIGGGKPDREGFLPLVVYAETKEAVIARAASLWKAKMAKEAARRARAVRAASASARRRGKAAA